MSKYKVWTHIDTGVEQVIEAKDEDDAIRIAEERLDTEEFKVQIKNNLQVGKTNIVEETKD